MNEFDQMKVDKADTIYRFCIDIIIWCCSQTPPVPFTVENPSRSWIWQLPPMKGAIAKFKLVLLHMDMCMHGSKRRKRTGMLTDRPDIFGKFEATFDGGHVHQKWGPIQDPVANRWTFATGQEYEYPQIFCDRIASCVAKHLKTESRKAPASRKKRPKPPQQKLRVRAQVGHQSKRLNSLCFVPDRKPSRTIRWQAPCPQDVPSGKIENPVNLGENQIRQRRHSP